MFGRATIRLGIDPHSSLVMVNLWNRTDHYIFMLLFVLLLLLSSFFSSPNLSAKDWMSAVLPHMLWP